MRVYEERPSVEKHLIRLNCDLCKKELWTREGPPDIRQGIDQCEVSLREGISEFGDEEICDLCVSCLNEVRITLVSLGLPFS